MNLLDHLPILPVVLPLFGGILLLALRNAPLTLQRGVSLALTLALLPLALLLAGATADGSHFVYKLGNWPAPFGIVLVADRLAAWMLLTTALLALLALVYAVGAHAPGPGEGANVMPKPTAAPPLPNPHQSGLAQPYPPLPRAGEGGERATGEGANAGPKPTASPPSPQPSPGTGEGANVMPKPSYDTQGRHFHVLYQLQLFGLNGAFLTGDLFNLFVFFEILLLASYGLLLHGGGRLRVKAGLHYVVINLVGSTLFLFAVGTLYGVTGTLNMADLAVKLAQTPPENLALVQSACLLLFGVFALKAALLPLHLWLPAAYAHTSAPVAALFAIMTKVGAYSILRVYSLLAGDAAGPLAGLLDAWLAPLALATLALGMFGALASGTLRQQAAYLVIASIGTLLLAFGLGSTEAVAAGLYYLPHTTFASAALFLLADTIARARGETADRFESAHAMPGARALGGAFFVVAVALAGLPPLAGFLGKFMLLKAALDTPWLIWTWSVVLAGGLAGVIALARSGSLLFYRTQGPADPTMAPPSAAALLPVAGLLLLVVGLTVWAGPLSDYAGATAAQLMAPQQYIDAVLGGTP